MKKILAIALAIATLLTACTSGVPLTPDEQAVLTARRAAIHQFNIEQVQDAMALGLIEISASPEEIFLTNSICRLFVLSAILNDDVENPVEVMKFCADIRELLGPVS